MWLTAGCSWTPAEISKGPLELSVVAFNLESGDADPTYIADQHLAPLESIDLWGLSEVQNQQWLPLLENGIEAGERTDFEAVLGTTGGGDRLAIFYNTQLFEVVQTDELKEMSFGGQVRAALVAQLRVRATGDEFLFMVNHLYRTENESRHQQAKMLNDWARSQTLPIVAVGDYNFDFDVTQGDAGARDRGFDLMTQDGIFTWVRPQPLTVSHCNDRYNTILDFIFVGNGAQTWLVKDSTVVYADLSSSYCPDDGLQSDHLPVAATFVLPNLETP